MPNPPTVARRRTPWATLLLLAANLIAAFAVLRDPLLAENYGFRPDEPGLRDALASLFLHANVVHLLGNMVFLAAVGAAVELATGPWRYLAVYFVGGIVGVVFYWAAARRLPEPAPLVGASGCVAACAAYYTFRYHALRVLVGPRRALPVAWITGLWLGLQLLGAVLAIGAPVPAIAFFAHLGGFLAGSALALAVRAPDVATLSLGHEMLDRVNERGPDALVVAARVHLKDHPDDPVALARLADALRDLGDAEEADVRLRLLHVATGEERRAALARLLQLDPARLTGRRRLQLAEEVAGEEPALAARMLDGLLDDPANGPDALLARASLSEPADPALLARLAAEHPLHPATDLARRRGLL